MAGETSDEGTPPPPPEYSLRELSQMMFDMNVRFAGQDKKLMTNRFEMEAFARKQDVVNKKLEDFIATMTATVGNKVETEPPDDRRFATASRGWKLPPSHVRSPPGVEPEALPLIRPDPPRFNGENASDWIRKIQKYYNHHYTLLADRLYLTTYLFDHPTSDWMAYWDDFLLAVKQRFDPDLYADYVGRLATLRQTTTVEDYQTEFESILQRVSNVADSTLTSLSIAGLKPSIQQELLLRRPATLQDAFALAQQIAACHAASVSHGPSPRSTWSGQDQRRSTPSTASLLVTVGNNRQPLQPPRPNRDTGPINGIPVVRISATERDERTKKGLCWYCDDAWSRSHVYSKKFYALMAQTRRMKR